jgi:ABC-type transporter Mla subunit MlaD
LSERRAPVGQSIVVVVVVVVIVVVVAARFEKCRRERDATRRDP